MKLRLGVFLGLISLLAACTVDIGNGSQLAGQRCFQESDCTDGLTCVERICRPRLGAVADRDAGGDDAGNNNTNDVANAQTNNSTNNVVNNVPDGGPPPVDLPDDFGDQNCRVGTRRCISEAAYEECIEVDEGASRFVDVPCGPEQICRDGRCVFVEMCRDVDDDGYGEGCEAGPDCDDANPDVNPGESESCDTPVDDDCDGRVNEGCEACCPNGCADGEFCTTDCECESFDPIECEYQNQPCVNEGTFENGYACFALGGSGELRCWGICQINADDPDSTCPDPNSACAFDAGDGQNGICMSQCSVLPTGESDCGPDDLGCLTIDVGTDDGICTPINPDNDLDDSCSSDQFFDCDEGLVCLNPQGGPQGRCREACRPFALPGMQSDCASGHCLPFSANFGVCFEDNMFDEGEICNPPQSACGEDAVGCYPNAAGDTECQRLCRLEENNADCRGNDTCTQFNQQQDELGVCL